MINMIVDFVNSFTLFYFALPLSRILSNLRLITVITHFKLKK